MNKRFSVFVWVSTLLALIQLLFDSDVGYQMASATAIAIGAAAAGAASLISDYINTKNQADTNEANRDIARENRDWQSAENEKSRAWSQYMFDQTNAYNTPSAQNARLREAGYNPYLISGLGQIGSGNAQATNAQTSSSAPQAPTMQAARVGATAGALQNLPGQLMQYYSTDAQVNAANANAANQSAQAEQTIINNAQEIYKMYGQDASEKYFATQMQSVQGSYDNNAFQNNVVSQVEQNQASAQLAKTVASLKDKYGAKEIQNNLDLQDQLISESVARIGKMASDRKLNDSNIKVNESKIKDLAASQIERIARAWNLRKQGDVYIADAATKNAIMGAYASQMESRANIMKRADASDYSTFVGNESIREWQESDNSKFYNLENFKLYQNTMLNELERGIKVLSPFVDKMPDSKFSYSKSVFE